MKIELLYPELANLHGDTGNIRLLKQCLPEAEFIETGLCDTPTFVSEKVDMIYLGSMSESGQRRVIQHLTEYRTHLQDCIDQGVVMLFTGNAMEVLYEAIEKKGGERTTGLHLLPLTAVGDFHNRYNSLVYGTFESMELVGFKTQFTLAYGEMAHPFMQVKRGLGMNREVTVEGVRINNLFATYLVGPLLVLNPPFCLYLLELLGVEQPQLPFFDGLMQAYQARLVEFQDPSKEFFQ